MKLRAGYLFLTVVVVTISLAMPAVAQGREALGESAQEAAGVVTGRVSDAWTGEAITDGRVAISPWDAGQEWHPVATTSLSNGEYRFSNLEAGRYRVLATSPDYVAYYSDAFWLGPGQVLTIDLSPVPTYGAVVAGIVCEVETATGMCILPDGDAPSPANAVAGVAVEARSTTGSLLGATTTDRWGWFRLEDLLPGTIVVSSAAPPGMELVDPVRYTLGRYEAIWETELKIMRVDTHLGLDSSVAPATAAPGEEVSLRLVATFLEADPSADPFDVTGVRVGVHLPPDVVYVGHTGEGRFDPSEGLWTIDELPNLGRAEMTIMVTVSNEGVHRLHAEIAASDWPDRAATYGDGRGDDFTEVSVEVRTPAPVDQAEIGGIVWLDGDGDGTRSGDERGLEGVTVLATVEGAPALPTVTGADGIYRFTELPAGVYRVSLQSNTLPEDVAAPETSYVLTLEAESAYLTADFGCTAVGGVSAWWFIGGGAAVAFLGLALLAGSLYYRRRGTPQPVDAESMPESVPV